MPHLDKITLDAIVKQLRDGDIEGATAEVNTLAPRYPADDALQRAKKLLEDKPGDPSDPSEALSVLEAAARTRLGGYKPASSLSMRDFREKEDRKIGGR